MKILETKIKDLYIIEPKVFNDERGYFFESYNAKVLQSFGINYNFVQDNESKSKKGVLRGLHFQKTHPQTKLVRVLDGEVFDVAVDLREDSPTYGMWVGVILSSENRRQFLIPRGFAHGFLVLSETATFSYKCDDFYYPADEGGLMYDDPSINIEWPNCTEILLSNKDKNYPLLKDCKIKF